MEGEANAHHRNRLSSLSAVRILFSVGSCVHGNAASNGIPIASLMATSLVMKSKDHLICAKADDLRRGGNSHWQGVCVIKHFQASVPEQLLYCKYMAGKVDINQGLPCCLESTNRGRCLTCRSRHRLQTAYSVNRHRQQAWEQGVLWFSHRA